MKFLLWAGVIVVVIWMLRSKKANKAEPPKAKASAATREIEAMLSCAHCGTHFPASEALRDASNQAFCSDEHRRQHVAH